MGALIDRELRRALCVLICTALLMSPPVTAQTRSAGLPALGDGEMTLGAERRMGERVAREIYRDPDFIDDPILGDYVDQVWRKLLAAARERGDLSPEMSERFAWEIMMGRDRSINAFALLGGYFGLHLGLIGVMSSRDELAAVLAHELSHVTQRHISRLITREKQQTPMIIAALILSALVASKSSNAASAIAAGSQAAAVQGQLNFSRDMEREADRIGYAVLEQAGYQTRGFATMFDKLQQASRLNDYGAFPYLRTHPLTNERVADMNAREPSTGASGGAEVADLEHQMMAARARALTQQGVDSLRSLVAEADNARVGSSSSARHVALLYLSALANIRLSEWVRASSDAKRLEELVRRDPAGARLSELLRFELALAQATSGPGGAPPPAITKSLSSSAVIQSSSGRRPEMLMAANFLLRTGRADEAAQRLRTWVSEHPRDASAWETLALANLAAGHVLRGIRAEAEAQVARYDYPGARDRFTAAQEWMKKMAGHPGFDHIEASIIDARARQVAALAREQALER